MIAASNPNHCISPGARHTINKRGNLHTLWQSTEWVRESEAYKARHFPLCSRCGRIAHIIPGHSGEDYTPHEMKRYIDKVRKDQVVPLCPQCNRMESKGRHPCPSCIEMHREDPDHYIRYIGQDQELCWSCEHGADGIIPLRKTKHPYAARKRSAPFRQNTYRAHPCRSHLRSGRCSRSTAYAQCEHSAKNALRDCGKFMARKKAVTP